MEVPVKKRVRFSNSLMLNDRQILRTLTPYYRYPNKRKTVKYTPAKRTTLKNKR
jgi:hypothetical protein